LADRRRRRRDTTVDRVPTSAYAHCGLPVSAPTRSFSRAGPPAAWPVRCWPCNPLADDSRKDPLSMVIGWPGLRIQAWYHVATPVGVSW